MPQQVFLKCRLICFANFHGTKINMTLKVHKRENYLGSEWLVMPNYYFLEEKKFHWTNMMEATRFVL
jgi:hypothetical protein